MKTFIGGPFSSAIATGEFDGELRDTMETVHETFSEIGCDVLSAHLGERWGKDVEEDTLVARDNRWLAESDVYIAVLPMRAPEEPWRTDGTFIEMGLAIAQQKPVCVLIEQPSSDCWSYYLRNLPRAERVTFVDLAEFLSDPRSSAARIVAGREFLDVVAATKTIDLHLAQTEPSTFVLDGVWLTSLPGVFSPKFSQSARYLLENVQMRPEDSVLDIGCGTGILGLGALMKGVQAVTFLDINPTAVQNAQINAQLIKRQSNKNFVISDGLAALDPSKKFDLFLFNPPYWNRAANSMLERAFYDEGYHFLKGVIRDIGEYAAADARLSIVFSDQGDIGHLVHLLYRNGWKIDELKVQKALTREHHVRILIQATVGR